MRLSSPFFFVKPGRFIQFDCGCCSIGYYAGIVVIMGSFVWTNDVNHLESREQKLSIPFKNAGNKSLAADCQSRKYKVLGQTLRISFNRANLKMALYLEQISSLMKCWYTRYCSFSSTRVLSYLSFSILVFFVTSMAFFPQNSFNQFYSLILGPD